MSKCLILFVEGDTEVEFYKRVIDNARQKRTNKRFDVNIECKNIKGVGGFKNIALRKFMKEIKPKYEKTCEFSIVLCRDTDVFELSPKPPVNWKEVEIAFMDNGAGKVIHVEARHSIEDWFLFDIDGILAFLHLPKKTRVLGGSGYEKMKRLFKQANKMYYKGMRGNGMVDRFMPELNWNPYIESLEYIQIKRKDECYGLYQRSQFGKLACPGKMDEPGAV